jgi:transcription elongation GreA/GreB family factor
MLSQQQTVGIGDKVLVALDGAVKELEIVSTDSDPKAGKISFLTPLAQALLGHKYPDRVTVKLPNGKLLDCKLFRVHHP